MPGDCGVHPAQLREGTLGRSAARTDPADALPATDKVYIVPLPRGDPVLDEMERKHWISAHGGVEANTIITVRGELPLNAVAAAVIPIIGRQAQWLGRNAVN